MEKGTKTIVERSWRRAHEISERDFAADMGHAARMALPVHRWKGEGRDGQPLTVVWVAGPETGALFTVYELSGGQS